jgi:SAM-dependent methyltransferase
MNEYWESRFKNEGAMWKSDPSDSAIFALDLFKKERISEILIPGFGYGRNARLFTDNGIRVTGIEISQSAIELAMANGLACQVHHGSVTLMPFNNQEYEGIFCYALIHLLNKAERLNFLKACYVQLKNGGVMVFTITSKKSVLYGRGKYLSKDRFQIAKGLKVYFYDEESVLKEFSGFDIIECRDIKEPIKFMEGEDPLDMILVICKKHEKTKNHRI